VSRREPPQPAKPTPVTRTVKVPDATRARSRSSEQPRQLRNEVQRSAGQPLDGELMSRMEARHWPEPASAPGSGSDVSAYRALERGAEAATAQHDQADASTGAHSGTPTVDFSHVRLHADGNARDATRRLGARAFTMGQHIYADPSYLGTDRGKQSSTLTHELAHVVQQQRLGRTFVQPQLIATGSNADIGRFISMAQAAMGEQLVRDPVTHAITANASLNTPATSPVFAAAMHRIMDNAAQNAEAHFGTGQPGVAVGAFPIPSDMTGSREQNIDMDDVEAIERGAPGNGLGKLAHELTENFQAHGAVPAAGVDRFGPAHQAGVAAESNVAEDTVGPGRRVADVDTPVVGNTRTRVQDFENYYLVFDLTQNPLNNDFSVSKARQAPRVNLSTTTIDQYVTGSHAVPATGAPIIAAAAAIVAANSSATVRIEGFTDSPGTPGFNLNLSQQRANDAAAALTAAGVGSGRIHRVGRGETNFVAANDTEANRARNRRVVITIDRPGP
jgi:outer membrane protein OmpA-like peptidoglycan-associated protein